MDEALVTLEFEDPAVIAAVEQLYERYRTHFERLEVEFAEQAMRQYHG